MAVLARVAVANGHQVPEPVLHVLRARLLDPLCTEVEGVQVSARRHGAGQRVRQLARARAAIHHHVARPELQLQSHHRDVRAVQNLDPEKYFNVDKKKYFKRFMHSIHTTVILGKAPVRL